MLDHHARLVTVRIGARASASGPDLRTIKVPVSVATKSPAVRVRFVVRANATGKVGAENFFLVDEKTLASRK